MSSTYVVFFTMRSADPGPEVSEVQVWRSSGAASRIGPRDARFSQSVVDRTDNEESRFQEDFCTPLTEGQLNPLRLVLGEVRRRINANVGVFILESLQGDFDTGVRNKLFCEEDQIPELGVENRLLFLRSNYPCHGAVPP